jgi:anthranilate phosphoribosyltransferase
MTAAVSPTQRHALIRLFSGERLAAGEAEALFAALVRGELSEAETAAMLLALKLRGETPEEFIGAALALRAACAPFPAPAGLFADSCGTGGDNSGSINVSTAVAFVAAAAGLSIVKHGNRSYTSQCGSADVLERLGVRIDAPADVMSRALEATGVAFLYAPQYHPGLRHAAGARKTIGVRTIMNVLGPCLNPARPPVQLLGVAEPALLRPVAETLAALGVARALVVHGGGLDEIALHGETQAIRVGDGRLEALTLTPEAAGFERRSRDSLKGGAPQENAERLRALLAGQGAPADADIVALNAGALLHLAGRASTLAEGGALARDTLRSGSPARVLAAFAEASHG